MLLLLSVLPLSLPTATDVNEAISDSGASELLLYQANNRINRRNGEAPSLHFSVDISPMRVEVREVHPSLTEFVTHLCAVLGGVFTTMGLIDGFFFYSTRALTKKTM